MVKSPAQLEMHQKRVFKNGHILEMKIWRLEKSPDYPEGLKYSLIYIDPASGKKVLMDNHSPKKHHYHLDTEEFDYGYGGIEKLIEDFRALVSIHMGVQI